MIPKIIHYCWFGKTMPPIVQRCIESWKEKLPDFQVVLWNENTFDVNSIPWTRECYSQGEAAYAYISDYVRLYALYKYGGIYLDADMLVFKSLEPLLNNSMFLSMENPGIFGTGVIGAEKGHPIIKQLLNSYSNKHYINEDNSLNIKNNTYIFSDYIKKIYSYNPDITKIQYLKDLSIYPKEYLYPSDTTTITNNSFCFHLGMSSHYKAVSVVMPVYNGAKYIRESIDSVLNQTYKDFEFIIVDDGSTDNTEDIVKSYNDTRIAYIKKPHSGISDTLNLGIKRSIGIYIARMDADDIMYPDRLEYQVEWMENHPEIDILGCGFEWGNGKTEKEYFQLGPMEIGRAILHQNVLGHPTVIMRKKSLDKLPFLYEKIYDGAEDWKLWLTAVTHGLRIYSEPKVVNYYRQHSTQASLNTVSNPSDMIVRAYYPYITNSKLTAIIPFQNEGLEVEKTVTSIRSTTSNVEIILVDDNSNDNYDYQRVADIFGCKYYRNKTNLGVAGSRDFGISQCTTPYFVLLDAHMRFYDLNWDERLVSLLDENNKRLITSNTVCIFKNADGTYDNEDGAKGRDTFGTYGAFVNMNEEGWEFTAKWTNKLIENKEVVPISCVLGAVYASSVEWWNRIGGLQGLIKYGLDEPLMSIKTWLAGGEVLLIKDWGVGHLYRDSGNYIVPSCKIEQNQLYLINLFSPENKIEEYENHLRKRIGEISFNAAKNLFLEQYDKYKEFKEYFYSKVAVHDLDYFLSINDKVSC